MIPEEQKYETSLESEGVKASFGPGDLNPPREMTAGQYTAPSSKYKKEGDDLVHPDEEKHYELV